ncbi:PREDICTED: keratin-associated protein 13-1-like [Hipposideros armiger]|uniref:Keratin-associated protein n=1 Tax=Hipposideros armiger TaxID=186990 RepID=A0A8B7QP05_HIPAR|nr:PREDICTED: keratin-associated protein 13-1-like [Hipposideros armiger]
MSYNCCSGSFSSRSLGGSLCYPGSSCGSSCPSNLVYTTGRCSPSTCQLGSSLYSGCQDTCCEPISCRTPCVVSSPCQMPCYRPRTSTLCRPSPSAYSGSLRCGSNGFRPLRYGVCDSPTLDYGSGFYHPTYFVFRNSQPFCYQPICRSHFYRLTW